MDGARDQAGRALLQSENERGINVKTRTAAFALALCLVSSLSFGETAVDAPLVVSDPYATMQPEQNAGTLTHKRDKKKPNLCFPQQAAQSTDKNQREKSPNRELPSQAKTSPSM
jgi:hypothetical protein